MDSLKYAKKRLVIAEVRDKLSDSEHTKTYLPKNVGVAISRRIALIDSHCKISSTKSRLKAELF